MVATLCVIDIKLIRKQKGSQTQFVKTRNGIVNAVKVPKERRRALETDVPALDSSDIPFLSDASSNTEIPPLDHDVRVQKAMVVDDDPLSALVIVSMLTDAGFDVQTADCAEDYLCRYAASNGRVDVLITDINMPGGMSGFDLLDHMRMIDPSLSVVVMTAEDEYDNVCRALELGAQGYIGKPFKQPTGVIQTVRTAAKTTRMIRDNEKLLEQLHHQNALLLAMSITDALTGVYNRRHIDTILKAQFARSFEHGRPLSVVLFDIDCFKSFNDDHGHDVGDEVLMHIARIVKKSIRAIDDTGRYGGEEFILILPDTRPADAESVAIRIRNLIEKTPLIFGDLVLSVTASFGVSGSEGTNMTGDGHDLVKQADIAMYTAKESGRNRVVLKRPGGCEIITQVRHQARR